MKNLPKTLAAFIITAAAAFSFAPPAHADTLHLSLNLGQGVGQGVYLHPPVFVSSPAPRVVHHVVHLQPHREHRIVRHPRHFRHPDRGLAYAYGRPW